MRHLIQKYAPDLIWDWYSWRQKSPETKAGWKSFSNYRRVKREMREQLWGRP